MNNILSTRKCYGDVFATVFDNGTIVPWKLLSTNDFIHYDMLIQSNLYPLVFVEDEIFTKCVVDPVLVQNIDKLKAGTVTAVAQAILQYSGPSSPEELNKAIELKRRESNNILHQIVVWITQAFPGYKLEELYDMSYPDLLLRLAQAEQKLIVSGVIKEPFDFFINEPGEKQKKQKPKPKQRLKQTQPAPPVENMAHKFQQQEQQEQTIITKADIIEGNMVMDGHTKDPVTHHKMAEETAKLYPKYLEQMKKGEKINIPSVEERKRAAEARAKENELKYNKKLQKEKEFTKEELERLKRIREQERQRRAKLRKR